VRCAVVPAAGAGRRFGGKKQFFKLHGRLLIEYSLCVFQKSNLIDCVVLVLPEEDIHIGEELRKKYSKVSCVVAGGSERQESVYRGLLQAPKDTKEVVVHDGARPLIDTHMLRELLIALSDYKAHGVVPGVKPKDTVKEPASPLEPGDHFVGRTLSRDRLILVQTPQVFVFSTLVECHERARKDDFWATDDSALLERYGFPVVAIPGDYRNVKVTTKEDLKVVSAFLDRDFMC